MKKEFILFSLILIFSRDILAQFSNNSPSLLNQTNELFFIENKGQWNEEVLFFTKVDGLDAWITKNGIMFDFHKTRVKNIEQGNKNSTILDDHFTSTDIERYGH